MLRYAFRTIAWLATRLPRDYRARVFDRLVGDLGTPEILRAGDLGRFHGSLRDRFVFQEYRDTGTYSPDIHAVLGELLGRGGTLVDVGANIGLVSVPVARRYGVTCHAFEPNPHNQRLLAKNAIENAVEDLVHRYPFALAGHDGELELELSEDNPGDHRLRVGAATPGAYGEDARRTIKVQVRRLDAVLDARSLRTPIVLKVDTQGAEVRVLAGAAATLATVDHAILEYWPYGLRRMGDSPDGFFAAMSHFPRAAIVDGPSPPRLRPTTEIVEELRARIPAAGSSTDHLDVLLARATS